MAFCLLPCMVQLVRDPRQEQQQLQCCSLLLCAAYSKGAAANVKRFDLMRQWKLGTWGEVNLSSLTCFRASPGVQGGCFVFLRSNRAEPEAVALKYTASFMNHFHDLFHPSETCLTKLYFLMQNMQPSCRHWNWLFLRKKKLIFLLLPNILILL